MKINRKFLESLNPCEDRWKNYLKHYKDWSGSLSEFLELTEISVEDKLWLIGKRIPQLEKIQREFAIICASRAVENCNIREIKEFFTLILVQFEADILPKEKDELYKAADRAAYWAADWAAYWAADWAAYRAADWAVYRAAYWAAYRAAYWAAYWAADRAAERKMQLDILKSLVEEVQE